MSKKEVEQVAMNGTEGKVNIDLQVIDERS